ncbi:MAG: beta-propeller fold lactonase family protein [Gammaproteobacteria bacterium]|jgi:YVTN family beta-propeller protein
MKSTFGFSKRFVNSSGVVRLLLFFLIGMLFYNATTMAAPFVYVGNHYSHNVTVIDAATDTVVTTIPNVFRPHGAASTPDGGRVYITNYGYNQTVSVIGTQPNAVIDTVYGVGNDPGGIAITPDGTRAYVANRVSNNVSVVDITSNSVIATIPTAQYPVSVAITPDGKYAYVANQTGYRITVIDTATNTIATTINDGLRHVGIDITPDGSRAYVVNDLDSSFSVIDTATNTVITTVPTGGTSPYWVAVSRVGNRAYIANGASGNVSVIDTTTNTVVALVPVNLAPYKLAVTADGKKLYVTNWGSNNVSVINTASNTVTATVPVGDRPLAITITPELLPEIDVAPAAYDFGDVETGSTATTTLTVSNTGGGELTISNVHLKDLISGDPFTYQLPLALPLSLAAGESLPIDVGYHPSLIYTEQASSLVIESDDEDEATLEVPLSGQGVLAEDPSQAIGGLKMFIDTAVDNGLLAGQGPGNSASVRLDALRNKINEVGELIAAGAIEEACNKLHSIYLLVDGESQPPDFVTGDAVSGIADGVLQIMTNLGCS